jgi:hypothetical protein
MNQAVKTARLAEQQDTVIRLNALTSSDWTVEAGALIRPDGSHEVATEMCAHGDGCAECGGEDWGTCYFPDADGLCPGAAVQVIRAGLVAGSHVSVDVVL